MRLSNSIDELQAVNNELEQFGESQDLAPDLMFNLNLVLEEVLTNIIFYGYDDSATHVIELNINLKSEIIEIEIIDDGKPFNPLERPDPNVNKSLDERQIGGLGIFLVKKIMDKAEYFRRENKNILNLQKNINTKS
ncbi:MAG: ATP-binding protein [Candidatus Marinimicrobia bacterium]|nr:ATP-binding protein [Candidatus Neomarinimicrobiota bacterium]MCK9559482.1 ATP-binding protein [Candidatus Neomarinimicrobiota bacterium]MDD5061712.1 ATP-binding protein [Candidatus Neomarinimicrobiota bacterium]MDD5230400.1 ATP-binding protein [Candidatus Neomarinimicrobiota bacterium]MDD5539801.1 ATP-binding protein [Candidatus Neomarinimicrobiota bacterium]